MPSAMPDESPKGTPRVGLVMEVPPPKDFLMAALAEASIPVAAEWRADELPGAAPGDADVLLVTLDEAIEPYLDRVTELVADSSVPVIFDESDVSRQLTGWDRNRWLRHLRAKLTGSNDTRPPLPEHAANSDSIAESVAEQPTPASTARQVWILGASVGGPESVRRFLEALPSVVPAAFVLVQHMGRDFQRVLADRLGRVTDLEVVSAEDGMALVPGRVVVAPPDQRLSFDAQGRVRLGPQDVVMDHSPSIDQVLFEATEAFGSSVGAIIFSGRARDGAQGCAELRRRGGRVWTQDAGSATISATTDAIRERGASQYSGTPEQLAARLLESARRLPNATPDDQGV